MGRVSDREGYHLPRHQRWQPNERQRLVLDALVENKTNPEIAEMLDITLDGAKWHVGELLSATGLSDRKALADWWAHERLDEKADIRRPADVPRWLPWLRGLP